MGKLEALREEVLKYAQPLCDAMSLDLVELTVRAYNETLHIELLADLPTGGISIEECSRLNRSLDKQLYEVMKLGDHYTLEVASPGLDRPLKNFPDFRRSIGRDVHVFFRERINGKTEMDGRIKGVRDAEIILGTKQGELFVGIEKIDRAKHII